MINYICLSIVAAASAVAQQPAFDIVSIRPAAPDQTARIESDCANGGRFRSIGIPLLWSIKWAYDINDYQLDDGWPAWLNARDAYNIEASSEHSVTEQQCKSMVRILFEDRFKLRLNHQARAMSAYALVKDKRAPKLAPRGRVIINGDVKQAWSEQVAPEGWTIARLANYLSDVRGVQRPVLDRTNLDGTFSFRLDYSTKEGDGREDIFSAVPHQLGLKLRPLKAPIEMWTVEHVERPSGN